MKFCPHCGGDIASYLGVSPGTPASAAANAPRPHAVPVTKGPYDQVKVWRDLVAAANLIAGEPPDITPLAYELETQIQELSAQHVPEKTIIHLVMDRKIVPEGGAVYMAAMSNGIAGPQDLSYFKARGYLIEDDKVRAVDDVPVGAIYGALEYWGGDKQHHRWHMAEPVKLNASRIGNPCFMDENMVAFVVSWKDSTKVGAAFLQLFEMLRDGVKGGGAIANPLVVRALRA